MIETGKLATLTLQVPDPYSIVNFEDLAVEIKKHFNVEMNEKNTAYYFILSNGLLDDFVGWSKKNRPNDPHWDCVNYLMCQIKNKGIQVIVERLEKK